MTEAKLVCVSKVHVADSMYNLHFCWGKRLTNIYSMSHLVHLVIKIDLCRRSSFVNNHMEHEISLYFVPILKSSIHVALLDYLTQLLNCVVSKSLTIQSHDQPLPMNQYRATEFAIFS